MVRTLSLATDWRVVISVFRPSGSSVMTVVRNLGALDAFDYAIHAKGYFRHAIQDSEFEGVLSIVIDVFSGPTVISADGRNVESIEITRD